MTKISFGAHPYLLGFEQLERLLERSAKGGAEGYPPFNIEAVAENAYRITLAVAGFREEERTFSNQRNQTLQIGDQLFVKLPKCQISRSSARNVQNSSSVHESVKTSFIDFRC